MVKACYIGFVLVLLSVACGGYAQGLEKADSLKRILDGKRGKDRIDVLWTLAKMYWRTDTVESSRYINESYALARITPVDSFLFVKTGKGKAMSLRLYERYNDAFDILNEVLPVARRHGFYDELGACLSVGGTMYSRVGRYDKALLYQLECLQVRERLADTLDISVVQNNLGIVYYEIGSYREALHYFFLSLRSKQSIRDNDGIDGVYINIGLCYLYLGEFNLGLAYAKRGLNLCAKNCVPNVVLNGTLALGMLYQKLDYPDSAKMFLSRCYNTALKLNNFRFQSESLMFLARQANDEGNSDQALTYSIESERNALKVNSRSMAKQSYYETFRARRGLKDYEGAAISWDKYLVYHDSLFNESLSLGLVSMHIEFEQKQNETRLVLQESTVQWQGRQNFWIALVGGLLIIAIELLIYDFTGRKRENEILEALVRDRTRALEEKVRFLERQDTERRVWDEKIERSVRDGKARLDALRDMVDNSDIKNLFPILNDGQEGNSLKTFDRI